MRKKKPIKKHSVEANLHVLELTRAGSSLDLAIYSDKEKIGTMIIGQGSLSWKGGADHEANSLEPVCGDDGRVGLRPGVTGEGAGEEGRSQARVSGFRRVEKKSVASMLIK